MEIAERAAGDVTILDVTGKMTLGEGDEILKDKVHSLALQGRKKIVLNLAGVPYIDSAGLGEIVRTYTTVSRQGGNLKLLGLTKRITDLLSITKLLTVFETYDNEADAVRSFASSNGTTFISIQPATRDRRPKPCRSFRGRSPTGRCSIATTPISIRPCRRSRRRPTRSPCVLIRTGTAS